MADTITLPGFGPTKKSTAYAIGAGVVLVGGIAWYRSRNAAAPAAADTTAAAQIDPATGFAYGSAEDTNALAGQSYSYSGGGLTDTSGGGGGYGGGGGGTPTPGAFTTNGQWSQAAEDYLVNTVGGDANAIGNALGKYITGQALTGDQVAIVEQAIAFTGYPPTNGATGYPPSYRTSNEPTPPPSTVPTNIKNQTFLTIRSATSWSNIARSYVAFGGNGNALYQYNLLPGKHDPNSYAKVERTHGGTIPKNPGFQVAIPVRGQKINLPGVGTVTS